MKKTSLLVVMLIFLLTLLSNHSAKSQSLQFNGSDQYVSVPHNDLLRLANASFSIEAWVNVNAIGSYHTILSKGGGNYAENTAFFFDITNTGKVGLYLSDGVNTALGASTSGITANVWYHVAVSYDHSSRVATFYINGQNAGTFLYSFTSVGGSDTQPMFIGRQGFDCACNYFNGKMDELRIWAGTKNAGQIAASSKFPTDKDESNLFAYYDFNAGSGSTLNSKSTTYQFLDPDGTLVNSPTWSSSEPTITIAPGTSNYVEFDGESDYIRTSDFSNSSSAELTAEAWIKAEDAISKRTIVSFENHSISFYLQSGYLYGIVPGGSVYINYQPYVGQLTHVAFTNQSGTTKLYINGVKVATGSGSVGSVSGPMVIGMASSESSALGFDGKITDLRLWKEARTALEIQNNISTVLSGSETNLSAYYSMSTGSGTILDDLTSNNYNGVFYEGQTNGSGSNQVTNFNGPRWTSDVNSVFPEFVTQSALSAYETATEIANIDARLGSGGSYDAGITYSLTGTDAAHFSINTSTGQLSANEKLDFDNPTDANGDNNYEFLVTAASGSLFSNKFFSFSPVDSDCTEKNHAPSNGNGYFHLDRFSYFRQFFTPCSSGVITALRINVGNVPTTGQLRIFSETSSQINELLNVALNTLTWNPAADFHTFTLIDLSSFDATLFEGNNYSISITGSDGKFGFGPGSYPGNLYETTSTHDYGYDLVFEVDVINIVNNAPIFLSSTTTDFQETAAGTVLDVDARDEYDANAVNILGTPADLNITYSLSGTDAAHFDINAANGRITFKSQPNFEVPVDSNGDNTYELTVNANDGINAQQNITITVTDVADETTFTSLSALDVVENTTTVFLDVEATKFGESTPDTGITYSIESGLDGEDFTVNATTGKLSFIVAPDFESPADANSDNIYELGIKATDANGAVTQLITATVINADEFTPPPAGTPDWSDPSSWESGQVPGKDDDISLPPNMTIAVDDIQSVKNLNVQTNTVIQISNGGALAIFGAYSGEGEVNQTREITGTSSGGYSIVGSPMTITPDVSTLPVIVYEYDGTVGFTAKTSGSLEPGKGYFLRESLPDGIPLDLALGGEPNTGDISVAVSTAGDGFNLLANPYTAAISVVDFIDNNPAIDGTLYLWDDGGENSGATRGGDYIAVNRMGLAGVINNGGHSGNTGSGVFDMNIGSLQGFFAGALTNGNVTFSQDMQVTTSASNAVYFRIGKESAQDLPQTVKLKLSNGELGNMLLVGLAHEASLGNDRGYDSEKFFGNNEISFYTVRDENKYAIEGLGMLEEDEKATFNLAFDLEKGRDYNISLEEAMNLPDNMDILLFDKLESKEYNLRENKNIRFTAVSGERNERFTLIFRLNSTILNTKKEIINFSLSGNTNFLNIAYPLSEHEQVKISTLDGKEVFNEAVSFKNEKALIDIQLLPKQLYILTIQNQSIKFLITE